MPVDELNAFCNAIETALAASDHALVNFGFLRTSGFSLFLQVLQNSDNKLNNSDD